MVVMKLTRIEQHKEILDKGQMNLHKLLNKYKHVMIEKRKMMKTKKISLTELKYKRIKRKNRKRNLQYKLNNLIVS